MPFHIYHPDESRSPDALHPNLVDLVISKIDKVVPEENKVLLLNGTGRATTT